jgi:demethylmenaquinone methyltransferase/2-methoxy-6-polyprenyl-1,4-benzoquinol methylase
MGVVQPGTDSRAVAAEPGRPTEDKVKGIFSQIAPTYDLVNILASAGLDRGWRRRAVRLARPGVDTRVLDLAAGTGDLTMAMARIGKPAEIVATDFVPEMLEVAGPKIAAYDGPTRITSQVADAQDLHQFADDSFNVVTVGFGVRNLPDRMANFREVHRVLAPKGRYVVLEFTTPPLAPVRGIYYWYLGTVVPTLGGMVSGDKPAYQYLNDSIRQFPDQRRLADELLEAGFASVEWHDLTQGIVAIHVATK